LTRRPAGQAQRSVLARHAFFLEGRTGNSFCLTVQPSTAARGGVLYVHPFAEEMNKARRMAALAAAAYAADGWMVLQPDLLGCGDSADDFGAATWDAWLGNLDAAWTWLRARCDGPLVLWGLRAGALLIADWLAAAGGAAPLLLWQPVTSGRQHLTQFLRLKAAGDMLTESDAATTMALARGELEAGRSVEVAGYRVSPQLARGLQACNLRLAAGYPAPVTVLEVAPAGRDQPSPAIGALTEQWRSQGTPVTAEVVAGAAFWQSVEIETAPALVEHSRAWLDREIR
jgi:exosortase A-associated hydrolase 2